MFHKKILNPELAFRSQATEKWRKCAFFKLNAISGLNNFLMEHDTIPYFLLGYNYSNYILRETSQKKFTSNIFDIEVL